MLDTASINFGIAKLQQAFSSVQPAAEKLTSEFVRYKVLTQVTTSIVEVIFLAIVLLACIPVLKYGKNKGNNFTNYDEIGFVLPTIVLGVVLLVLLIVIPVDLQQTVLAISFPEMFTINSIVSK